jgi:hypothetical protein
MLTMNHSGVMLARPADAQQRALELFHKSAQNGFLSRIWRRLAGHEVGLRCLGEAGRHGGRDLGHLTVAIGEIIGSEGRVRDFDATFAPLSDRTRDRWMSVALARLRGCNLPAVKLVRAEDGYYVRDGHHRISVARALGEEFVEADVIAWE